MTGSESVAVALANALSRPDSFVGRILSPLVDGADYLSDKIRFARWKASLDTLERANAIAKERGLKNGELAIRFLAPWLEGASLQPEDTDELANLWASLLIGASQRNTAEDLVFVDVLKKIGEREARLIKWFGARMSADDIEHFVLMPNEGRDFGHILKPFVQSLAEKRYLVELPHKKGKRVEDKVKQAFRKVADKNPLYPESIAISMGAHFSFSEEIDPTYDKECDGASLDVLKYVSVIDTESAWAWRSVQTGLIVHEEPADNGDDDWWGWGIGVVKPTRFGAKLIAKCIYPDRQLRV